MNGDASRRREIGIGAALAVGRHGRVADPRIRDPLARGVDAERRARRHAQRFEREAGDKIAAADDEQRQAAQRRRRGRDCRRARRGRSRPAVISGRLRLRAGKCSRKPLGIAAEPADRRRRRSAAPDPPTARRCAHAEHGGHRPDDVAERLVVARQRLEFLGRRRRQAADILRVIGRREAIGLGEEHIDAERHRVAGRDLARRAARPACAATAIGRAAARATRRR